MRRRTKRGSRGEERWKNERGKELERRRSWTEKRAGGEICKCKEEMPGRRRARRKTHRLSLYKDLASDCPTGSKLVTHEPASASEL